MQNYIAQIFGRVAPPPGVSSYGAGTTGLRNFISNGIKTIIVIAGIYAFLNIILAGYSFMSAGGNPEKVAAAWAKIWQTMLGLLVAAASFVLAGIFGHLIFGDYNALLQLRIFTP
jgi:succinate dehydrogenase hydrophobic anchor subunit